MANAYWSMVVHGVSLLAILLLISLKISRRGCLDKLGLLEASANLQSAALSPDALSRDAVRNAKLPRLAGTGAEVSDNNSIASRGCPECTRPTANVNCAVIR